MDDDDDYPQFGNAFPSAITASTPSMASTSTSTSHTAWNPALRPDTAQQPEESAMGIEDTAQHSRGQEGSKGDEVEDDDDFFARYPGATPKKAQPLSQPEPSVEGEAGDDDAQSEEGGAIPPSFDRGKRISVEQVVDVRRSDASPEDLRRGASSSADAEGPVARYSIPDEETEGGRFDGEDGDDAAREGDNDDEEGAVFARGAEESAEEQARDLEGYAPDTTATTSEAAHGVEEADTLADEQPHTLPAESEAAARHPEQQYEHQSALTAMEVAQDEEPEASLLQDEEAPPTPGNLEPEEATLDLDGESGNSDSPLQPARASKAHHQAAPPPAIDRSFTTNFTEIPTVQPGEATQPPIQEENEENSSAWPSAAADDDDKTFGELLDDHDDDDDAEVEALPSTRQRPHATHPPVGADGWAEGGEDDETFGKLLGERIQEASEPADDDDGFGDQLGEEGEGQEGDDAFGDQLGDSPGEYDDANAAPHPHHHVPTDHGEPRDVVTNPNVTSPDLADGAAESEGDDLAAAWQAALDDDELLVEDGNDLDPATLFGDDDGGLLLGDDDEGDDDFLAEPAPPSQPQQQSQQQQQQQQQYQQGRPTQAAYQPTSTHSGPSSTYLNNPALAFSRAGGTPDTGLFDVYDHIHQQTQTQQQQQRIASAPAPQRPGIQQAQSFADKSKGGYQSPYDLPMEVVKPRQRPRVQHAATSAAVPGPPGPPMRTSSFGPGAVPPSNSHVSNPLPTTTGANGVITSAKSTPKTGGDSGFFADLPMVPKPRARPVGGAYTPLQSPGIGGPQGLRAGGAYTPQLPGTPGPPPAPLGPAGPPQAHPSRAVQPPPPPQQQHQRPAPPPQQPSAASIGGVGLGLRQPERMPLLPEQPQQLPQQHQQTVSAPVVASRYSPSQTGAPAAQSRYSPAPAPPTSQPAAPSSRYSPAPTAQPGQVRRQVSAGPPGVGMAKQLPFAPRTSSPLAWSDKPQPPLPMEAMRGMTVSPPRVNEIGSTAEVRGSPERRGLGRYSPAEAQQAAQPLHAQSTPPMVPPPPRPRTQSPGATMKQPRLGLTAIERPMSAAGAPSYFPSAQQPTSQATATTRAVLPHRRQFSRELTFAAPANETAQDPLERWKGGPIFQWTAGGSIVTSFPKQTPVYAGGQGLPSLKCMAGDIKLVDADAVLPLDERDVKFPGPLTARAKGRKKEVLAWMDGKIEALERGFEGAVLRDFSLPVEVKTRAEEKIVLWRIMRVFVEHDGVLEGKPRIEEEVRKVLLPNLAQMAQVMDLQSPVSAGGSSVMQAEAVDRQTVVQIRQALLEGQREKAVWLAEEKKLWGHAMLLASTLGPEVWKQIVQSFVRAQVKTVGSDARSLAALYQVFAGNSEECVDELVPPSARAGFRMVSKADGTAAGDPLQGLDQWRETLGMVVGNRSANDGASLVALGKLLAGYGRPEAAHTCFLFGRSFAKHSGADDSEAHFVLLGADTAAGQNGAGVGGDLDTILLTEIYEWASSLAAPAAASPYAPHLQAYKLVHAQTLAAHGHKTAAQVYCDHITTAYTSTTRPSQYYHPTFTTAVADLSAFLSQAPQDGGAGRGSWMGKGARNQVASKTASWFTKFVSGDDEQNDAAAAAAGLSGDEAGPFGRVSGEISRSASGTELYNPMMVGSNAGAMGLTSGSMPGPAAALTPGSAPGGRYAPGGNRYAPGPQQTPSPAFTVGSPPQDSSFASPTDTTRSLGIPSFEAQQRPMSAVSAGSAASRYAPTAASGLGLQPGLGLGVPKPELNRAATDFGGVYNPPSRRGSAQDPGSQGSYEPSPSLAQEPGFYGYHPSSASQAGNAEDAIARSNGAEATPPPPDFEAGGVADAETAGNGYEPPSSGYGYEPPSYQPYQPEPDVEEDVAAQPKKKKGIMDLDDDDDDALARSAAALKKQQADREADDAFRKAAEADAARDKQSAGSDGKGSKWFGGWFAGGGKKDLGSAGAGEGQNPNKPIRAKLGEENSFYYDETLKKWVNKKAGAEAGGGTPASATPPPPRGPPSRVASGMIGPPSGPPSRVSSGAGFASLPGSRPPTSGGVALPGSGPPSRAATPASVAGFPESAVPAHLNGEGMAPPSRPGTGMSTASSLDDLLGAMPRKAGGTVKGKKKGGRYVDVMAK